MRKPKSNRGGGSVNACQTRSYALDPLLPYLPRQWTIWESAAGEGYLARALRRSGYNVVESDITRGQDFFAYRPTIAVDAVVTNPPFNPNQIKSDWMQRCCDLGLPWANLMPVDTIGSASAQKIIERCNVEIIYMDKRINFKMPNKGWSGKSQFSSAWFTCGLGIGRQMTFAHIAITDEDQPPLFQLDDLQPALFKELL